MTEERLQKIIDEISDNGTRIMRPNMVMKAMKQAVNEALDEDHTEGLREENGRLKLALYTITRAYQEYGVRGVVAMNNVAKNILKEVGFDPSEETK